VLACVCAPVMSPVRTGAASTAGSIQLRAEFWDSCFRLASDAANATGMAQNSTSSHSAIWAKMGPSVRAVADMPRLPHSTSSGSGAINTEIWWAAYRRVCTVCRSQQQRERTVGSTHPVANKRGWGASLAAAVALAMAVAPTTGTSGQRQQHKHWHWTP
jgi:hypothetical protein